MAKNKMALLKLLRKAGMQGDMDFLQEGVQVLAQALMDIEVAENVGAERHELSLERRNYRKGYRLRRWDTRVGTVGLRIPKLRHGSYSPSLLESRRRAERTLVSVIQEDSRYPYV